LSRLDGDRRGPGEGGRAALRSPPRLGHDAGQRADRHPQGGWKADFVIEEPAPAAVSAVVRLQGAATGDRIFRTLLTLASLAIPVLLGFLVFELWSGSRLAIRTFGVDFL